MNHILVLPEEFETKLNEAHADNDIHSKWLQIGVDTVQDMINRVISEMNERFPKLSITNYRADNKDNIKETIGNRGSNSVYAGYFETEKGNVDGLFFYIPPSLNSGNDLLTRQVLPSLLGIYEGISQDMVKYLDIFGREFHDVITSLNGEDDDEFQITSLTNFNRLFATNGNNELFVVDDEEKVLQLLSTKLTTSTNPSAEMYRYCLKVLPAIYMAIDAGYQVNIDAFDNVQMGMFDVIRAYVSKI